MQPIPEIHGDWLVVTRRKRNQNQFKQGPRKSSYLTVNERPTGKSQPHMLKGKGSGQDLKGKKAQDMTTAWNRIWASKKKRRHEGEAQLVVEMDSTPPNCCAYQFWKSYLCYEAKWRRSFQFASCSDGINWQYLQC